MGDAAAFYLANFFKFMTNKYLHFKYKSILILLSEKKVNCIIFVKYEG